MDHSFVPPPVPQKDEKFVPPSLPPENQTEMELSQKSKGKKLKWVVILAATCVALALCVVAFYVTNRSVLCIEMGSDGVLVVTGYEKIGFGGWLVIPNGVKYIKDGAFMNCEEITRVTIPGSVEQIGMSAFYGCTNLEKVTIKDGVKYINALAFVETNLTELTIPESVKSIGILAFARCPNLTKVTIPEKYRDRVDEIFYDSRVDDNFDSIQFTFY